ncbi:DDE-type integrase/transposase/recombinase [Planobispora rosea]|uniref:DDE-type integrase/transposase/recombinase n=1 Tax=Planobispora rosea TaxID=35762 RepID=UPI00114D2B4B|nr:DDE-type integrase/transposase/recombinase [Planobispora rosea]
MPASEPDPATVTGRPGAAWIGDAFTGFDLAGRSWALAVFIDERSRMVLGYRWDTRERPFLLAAALRAAITAYGLPECICVDHSMGAGTVKEAASRLGVTILTRAPTHLAPRSMTERWAAGMCRLFRHEITTSGHPAGASMDPVELNRRFGAWLEKVYHRQVQPDTGTTALQRWRAGTPPRSAPAPAVLSAAFTHHCNRSVSSAATIRLLGTSYNVDAGLVGQTIDASVDVSDPSVVPVRLGGRPMGLAVPVPSVTMPYAP